MRLVMKFGGTAVDSPEKVRHVAQLVKSYKKGNDVVCVDIDHARDVRGVHRVAVDLERKHVRAGDERDELHFPGIGRVDVEVTGSGEYERA